MSSDELFEAVSHPLRIEIVKALAKKPLRFADLKRKLKISSSGLLDFHLKIDDLVAVNGEGCYYLNESGYAALTVIESVSGYHKLRLARRRSFYLNLITCVLVNIGAIWTASQLNDYAHWYAIILPITVAWTAFYSYWTLVKRGINLKG